MTPNPGSTAAITQGCTCPVIDNEYGRGFHFTPGCTPIFTTVPDCSVHHSQRKVIVAALVGLSCLLTTAVLTIFLLPN